MCVCKRGFYFPNIKAVHRYYNGTVIEEEYEKLMLVSNCRHHLPLNTKMRGKVQCFRLLEHNEFFIEATTYTKHLLVSHSNKWSEHLVVHIGAIQFNLNIANKKQKTDISLEM